MPRHEAKGRRSIFTFADDALLTRMYLAERSYAEIARALGRSESTISSRCSRLRTAGKLPARGRGARPRPPAHAHEPEPARMPHARQGLRLVPAWSFACRVFWGHVWAEQGREDLARAVGAFVRSRKSGTAV